MRGMQRKSWVWMLAVVLLSAGMAFGAPAHAQRVEGDRAAASGAYEAEVAVRNQAEAERNAGFGRALAVVLGKVTGDRGAAQRPGVRDELGNAKTYVAGYDYRQDEGMAANGAPTFQTTLVVRFQRDDVDQLIQMLGLPSWPQPRPKPVLWLAINDGSGPRLVSLAQVNAARAILDAAKSRGFALGLPGGNAAEQAAVGAIWRGDTAAIAGLSRKYSPPMQLIGKLQRSGGGWVADWTFVDKGKTLSSWQTTHADARRAMAGGAEGAADALFKRYAKAGSGGPAGIYRVRILDVDSADDYLRLIGYLDGVAIVKRVRPVLALPGELQLDLELATGVSGFARLVERGDVLSVVSAGGDGDQQADGKDGDAPSTSRVATFRIGS